MARRPENATVTLLPATGTIEADTPRPSGAVTADGTFTLSTYFGPDDLREGAPPGQYVAIVSWYGKPAEGEGRGGFDAKNLIPKKYTDPETSPLKVEIKEEPNTLEPFELEGKAKKKK